MEIKELPDDAFLDERDSRCFLGVSINDFNDTVLSSEIVFPYFKTGRKSFYRLGDLRSYKEQHFY